MGIETSALVCSIAWWESGNILLEYNIERKNRHAQLLPQLADRGFKYLNIEKNEVDLVVIASGPGSFTGLRIGMAYAKGFCYALDCKLIAVSNFELMSAFVANAQIPVHVIIDAGRGKLYHTLRSANDPDPLHADVISWAQLMERITGNTIIVKESRLVVPDEIDIKIPVFNVRVTGAHACLIGTKKYNRGSHENLNDIEPFYLQKFAGMA